MSSPTFQGVRFIILPADRDVLRQILPESLRKDFDTGANRYNGKFPAILGDPLNLESGLSWGAEYNQDTIVVYAVDPGQSMTYERVRELEDSLGVRKHPEIVFSPIVQPGDKQTDGIVKRNHAFRQHWDAGLVGPGSPNP